MTSLTLTSELDPRLSRWLWLVKMFLALPHFTGRYPRSLFTFAVGVMRWNWRVSFYVHAALGTDRYPPFSLRTVDEYPATLEVAHPERLSRALVVIKWLLAIPHVIVIVLISGTLLLYPIPALNQLGGELQAPGGYSVLNLLVVVAGFFLLITGKYPAGLFDLLIGLSRWEYRTLVYVALMSDEYPPFRLDTGPTEPKDA